MSVAPPQPRYIAAFDGIRALAVLWVMAYHILSVTLRSGSIGYFHKSPVRFVVQSIIEDGWIGVPIFFALSGFLITGILFDSLHDPHFFRNFYARRVLRIFPLYYGVLLLLFALTPVLHLHWGPHPWAWFLYLQGAVAVNFIPRHHIDLTHFWTLAIEEQFYFIWPLVLFLVRGLRRLVLLAFAVSVASLGFRVWLAHIHHGSNGSLRFLLPAQLDALLLGGAAALLLRSAWRNQVLRLGPILFLGGSGLLLAEAIRQGHALTFEGGYFTYTVGFSLLALASSGLLLMAWRSETLTARALSWAPLRFIGRYSYGIYVLHHLVQDLAIPIRDRFYSAGLPTMAANLVAFVITSAVSVGLAVLSFHLFEERFLRLKRYFVYRVPPATQSPALDDPSETVAV